MHHIVRADEINFQPPPNYQKHSQGYSRFAMVDHRVQGAVHSGTGLCRLEPGGVIAPHVHSFEEGFYIMEGEALVSLDDRAYRLGPGDYGVMQIGVPHAWRNIGPEPVRWLEMLSPQPRPDTHPEQDTFFLKDGHAPEDAGPP
ncbi:MAG: cupin domain-containing protein, partial [Anaerolineae bacterium]|nr:cupin domain-containing protein [Anaerolineae bacterium]